MGFNIECIVGECGEHLKTGLTSLSMEFGVLFVVFLIRFLSSFPLFAFSFHTLHLLSRAAGVSGEMSRMELESLSCFFFVHSLIKKERKKRKTAK